MLSDSLAALKGIKSSPGHPAGGKGPLIRLVCLCVLAGRCSKLVEYRRLMFSLCYFHACLLERKKFLNLGW